MRKTFLVLIGFLIISIIIALVLKFPSDNHNTSSNQENILSGEDINGDVLVLENNNPLVYTNTEFGFQLTLPEGWEDYKAFSYSILKNDQSWPGLINAISIVLPTQSNPDWPGVENPSTTTSPKLWVMTNKNNLTGYAAPVTVLIWSPEGYQIQYKKCQELYKIGEVGCLLSPFPNTNPQYNKSYYFSTWLFSQELPDDISKRLGVRRENLREIKLQVL